MKQIRLLDKDDANLRFDQASVPLLLLVSLGWIPTLDSLFQKGIAEA